MDPDTNFVVGHVYRQLHDEPKYRYLIIGRTKAGGSIFAHVGFHDDSVGRRKVGLSTVALHGDPSRRGYPHAEDCYKCKKEHN